MAREPIDARPAAADGETREPAGRELVWDGADDDPVVAWRPPCVERALPGDMGSTWVHAYTARDVAQWRKLAQAFADEPALAAAGTPDTPSETALARAQAIVVCRRGPGETARTFRVTLEGMPAAWAAFDALPGTWVDQVCRDADSLTLIEYHRPNGSDAADGAQRTLRAALVEPELWRALDYLSRRLFGVPIAENDEPLADVLAMLDADTEARMHVAAALAPLAERARVRS